jgi:hypothetical protein
VLVEAKEKAGDEGVEEEVDAVDDEEEEERRKTVKGILAAGACSCRSEEGKQESAGREKEEGDSKPCRELTWT